MASAVLTNLLKMLDAGRDSAMLRFGLGNEYLKLTEAKSAAEHLAQSVKLDPHYSAAWKLLGRALTECGEEAAALRAYEQGIEVAEAKGDKQAAKEMSVFARRLRGRTAP